MLESKRFLYVGFLCHQVVEKCLKAYFWHTQEKQPPYSHTFCCFRKNRDSTISPPRNTCYSSMNLCRSIYRPVIRKTGTSY